MTVTLHNVSRAVASADAHREYAYAQQLMGNRKLAIKHANHADSIMRDVMRVTDPGLDMSDDEILAELMS